jgi:hypothetical protein
MLPPTTSLVLSNLSTFSRTIVSLTQNTPPAVDSASNTLTGSWAARLAV